MAEKVRKCSNTHCLQWNFSTGGRVVCTKLQRFSVPEELIYKSLSAIVETFLPPCAIICVPRSMIFVGKISLELMYLESQAKIPNNISSFWRQQCNKGIGKIGEQQCCWLCSYIQHNFAEKAEKSMFPVMVISRYLNHLIRQ